MVNKKQINLNMCGCKANNSVYRGVSKKQPKGKGMGVYRRGETSKKNLYSVTAQEITTKTSHDYGM